MADLTAYNSACDDNANNRTLKQLRDDMMRRLGFGAQVNNPPPGMAELLNSFLVEAQELLYRRYDVLRTERFYSWPLLVGVRFYGIADNAEAATLATPTGVTVATASGGTLAAGSYAYRVSATNANGETLASTEAMVTAGASGKNTITVPAVTGATGYNFYGRTAGAELLLGSSATTSFVDDGSLTPAGALPVSNTTAICPKMLDPRKVSWVGVERDGRWYPLQGGIPPELYSLILTNNWPQRYEIRSAIEVWPAPGDTLSTLRVKGDFGLEAFAADTDKTTIDDRLVFLLALANAKAHYGRPDAGNYVSQLETMMQNLVAGSHQTRRYIPGRDDRLDPVYVQPQPTVPFS